MSELKSMNGKSMDITQQNIQQLKKLFPSVVTEGKVDFEKLRLILGDQIDDKDEKYQFTWNGKKRSEKLTQKPSTGTLRPNKEKSKNWDNTDNLFIEGDNLEVLKLLQKSYNGKIDVIYIDPPYNTGNDFVYNDSFSNTIENYYKQTGQIDSEGKRLSTNLESSGRYHTDWLNMMYPRLILASHLLSRDGLIFISIGDEELYNLKKMCDEIFGENNFITMFIWEKTQHFGRQKKNFYSNADYILVYAKQLYNDNNEMKELMVEYVKTNHEDAPLFNASNPNKDLVFPAKTVKFNIEDGVYKKSTDEKYRLLKPVVVENGYNKNDLCINFSSRWSQEKIIDEIDNGCLYWVKSDKFSIRVIYGDEKYSLESPKQIVFTNRNNSMCTYSRFNEKVGTSEEGSAELDKLLGSSIFSYPKPVSLMKYIISLPWGNKKFKKSMTILDFFAGSSTTAQAVMELNAEDGGDRKFIMVQLPEVVDDDSSNKFNNLSDLSQERIRRAGEEILSKSNNNNIDVGFRVFELDKSNIKTWNPDSKDLQTTLADQLNNFIDGRSSEDVVYEILLKLGLSLSTSMKVYSYEEVEVYDIAMGTLYIVLGNNITRAIAKKISLKQENYQNTNPAVVFNDNGFINDNEKLNSIEILKNSGFESDQIMSV